MTVNKVSQSEAAAVTGATATPAANAADMRSPQSPSSALYWGGLLLLVVISFLARALWIDTRPLHSDEGVNTLFFDQVEKSGYYSYTHENYHGPLYFYLQTPLYFLLGQGEWALRSLSIICGSLLVAALALFRRELSWRGILLSAAFIALSPSLVFYSRYAIHETLLLLLSLLFCRAVWGVMEYGSRAALYSGALLLAGLVATKETYIITLFALGCACLVAFGPRAMLKRVLDLRYHLPSAALLGAGTTLLIYSGGGRMVQGVRELLLGVPAWVERGKETDKGHFKRFGYYLFDIFAVAEPWLVVGLVLIPLVVLLHDVRAERPKQIVRKLYGSLEGRFVVFSFVWAAVTVLVYSGVNYKTPWLIINLTLPLIIFCVAFLTLPRPGTSSPDQDTAPVRRLMANTPTLLLALILGASFLNMARLNFAPAHLGVLNQLLGKQEGAGSPFGPIRPYGPGNPFSYVHTSQGMVQVVDMITALWERDPSARVLIAVGNYWPLPYYLRERKGNLGYLSADSVDTLGKVKTFLADYKIVIAKHTVLGMSPDVDSISLRLSDVEEARVFVKKENAEVLSSQLAELSQ